MHIREVDSWCHNKRIGRALPANPSFGVKTHFYGMQLTCTFRLFSADHFLDPYWKCKGLFIMVHGHILNHFEGDMIYLQSSDSFTGNTCSVNTWPDCRKVVIIYGRGFSEDAKIVCIQKVRPQKLWTMFLPPLPTQKTSTVILPPTNSLLSNFALSKFALTPHPPNRKKIFSRHSRGPVSSKN